MAMHGGPTNALVCILFSPTDLKAACRPSPWAERVRCLIQIDLKNRHRN
ncbi:MAG: hypothetical protein QFX38_04535 [Methanothermobacter sp.]|nr:hypothetical protein [Methanothermobacter sp.]